MVRAGMAPALIRRGKAVLAPSDSIAVTGTGPGTAAAPVGRDAALALARFDNGAIASIEGTRFAPGRRNYNRFEVNGSRGSLAFQMERMNELEYYSLDDDPKVQGFRQILATAHQVVGFDGRGEGRHVLLAQGGSGHHDALFERRVALVVFG